MHVSQNKTVLMSGAKYFAVKELNPYSSMSVQPDPIKSEQEFLAIKAAVEQAGITVIKVDEPVDCQDGIFTANWGLVRGDRVVLSSLPGPRKNEEVYAENVFRELGKTIIRPPYRFSGQGDSLPCGNLLFIGSGYRTDPRMHQFLADQLGYDVIELRTVPLTDAAGNPVVNSLTGWPDSFFYDIDLAISILRPDLIAWCPEAFVPDSQEKIRSLSIQKIEITLEEAKQFACNILSSGETVIMGHGTPAFQKRLEAVGLQVTVLDIRELAKGGGYIRCTTLTLDNE